MAIALSILDQSPVTAGSTPARALDDTAELARATDHLGYRRYWVAEHHHSASFAGTAPAVLAAVLLQNTKHMRIGSGGVLLPRHDPVSVAEQFQILADLHPGRVDLGIGRAGGPADTFPEKLAVLRETLAAPRSGATPGAGPEIWLLGTGTTTAELATRQRLGFCFGHFLSPSGSHDTLERLRSTNGGAPRTLAVRVFVAATAATAEAQAADYLLWRSRKDLGADEPLPPAGAADRHRWSAAERTRANRNSRAIVVGDPRRVRDTLVAMAAEHHVDEVVVNTLLPTIEERHAAYQLLSHAFGLRR